MHFYAWEKGLKTGMYYLRTKSAVDAIQFTVDQQYQEKAKATEETKQTYFSPPAEGEDCDVCSA